MSSFRTHGAAGAFMALGDEQTGLAEDQRSLPRTAFSVVAVVICLLAMPLFWAATAVGHTNDPAATVASKGSGDGEAEDNSGPGGGGDDDTRDRGRDDTTGTTTSDNRGTTRTNTTSNRKAGTTRGNDTDRADDTRGQTRTGS